MSGLVQRYDAGRLKQAHRTPEGYLYCEGYATRTGVFTYMLPDGTLRRELRLPEEVSNPDSLSTLGLKPVTLEHPPEPVTSANVQDYEAGTISEEVVYEGADGYVKVRMAVRRKDAVEAVERGKRELSCGYTCKLDDSPGTYEGEAYDCIQREIRYNHLAITDRGRAGYSVRLRADSEDAVMVSEEETMPPEKTASIEIGGVRYDGVEPEVAREVAKEIKVLNKDLETARTDAATYKNQLDAAKKDLEAKEGEAAQLKTRIEELEAKIAAKTGGEAPATPKGEGGEDGAGEEGKGDRKDSKDDFLEKFNARLNLLRMANKLKVEKVDTLDNDGLKRAIIEANTKGMKLDGKSVDFIDGYINSLSATLLKESDLKDTALDISGVRSDGKAPSGDTREDTLEEARKDYMKNTYGA